MKTLLLIAAYLFTSIVIAMSFVGFAKADDLTPDRINSGITAGFEVVDKNFKNLNDRVIELEYKLEVQEQLIKALIKAQQSSETKF